MTLTLAEIHLDDALIAVALLAAALSLCVIVRKRRSRQAALHPAVERDIQQLLAELAQMASNISAELDARTESLKTLLKQADEKIAALKRATTETTPPPLQVRTERSADPDLSASDQVITSSSAPDTRYIDVYTLADQGQSSQQIAQHLGRPSGEVELILALRSRT